MKKDIILIMSDQHNGRYTSLFGEYSGLTLNLQRFGDEARVFSNAYCNAPLCVPSRMSFLTGKLPSETLIFDNDSILNSDEITLPHKVSLAGYETILIGRMHFKGLDQFHGFDKRYLGDITSQYWGQTRDDLQGYHKGFKAHSCQELVTHGYSPVRDFDTQVYNKAIEIIEEESRRPRLIVVGFYAPHFPYISELKSQFDPSISKAMVDAKAHRLYGSMVQDTTLEKVHKIETVYMEMIHELDAYVGHLYDLVKQKNRDDLFIYTSDHGDQLGIKGIFGKKVLYQDSIHIPLIIDGLFTNGHSPQNVSLIDLHHWIVKFAQDNQRLEHEDTKPTVVQQIIEFEGKPIWTEAIISGLYKLMRIGKEDTLYQIDAKGFEIEVNDAAMLHKLKALMSSPDVIEASLTHYIKRKETNAILIQHGKNKNIDSSYTQEIKDKFHLRNFKESKHE